MALTSELLVELDSTLAGETKGFLGGEISLN